MMTVDDEKLIKLFEALEPKQRRKAIRAALTRAGAQLRKAAIKNLRATKLNDATGLSKGIRRVNYKGKLGFRITVGTKIRSKNSKNTSPMKASEGYHTNRNGLVKPVLLWAEGGTKSRRTKTESSWRGSRRKRRGHPTGTMPRYGFMQKTKEEMTPKMEAILKDEINLNIQKIARKYGCTIS